MEIVSEAMREDRGKAYASRQLASASDEELQAALEKLLIKQYHLKKRRKNNGEESVP